MRRRRRREGKGREIVNERMGEAGEEGAVGGCLYIYSIVVLCREYISILSSGWLLLSGCFSWNLRPCASACDCHMTNHSVDHWRLFDGVGVSCA